MEEEEVSGWNQRAVWLDTHHDHDWGKESRSMKVRTRPVVRQAENYEPFILKLPRELVVKPIL